MKHKEIALKILIMLAGLISVGIMVVVKSSTLQKRFIDPAPYKNNGGMYRLSQLTAFQNDIPPKAASTSSYEIKKAEKVNEAEVFLLGDSFLDFRLGFPTFFHQFVNTVEQPAVRGNARQYTPITFAEEFNLQWEEQRRVMIYQKVDRFIDEDVEPESGLPFQIPEPFRTRVFKNMEKPLHFLAQYQKVGPQVIPAIRNFRYNTFGLIPAQTPVVDAGHTQLFLAHSVDDVFDANSDEEIAALADEIAEYRRVMDEQYNIEMIVLPLPNKFTVYHDTVDMDVPYDNFLPRLHRALAQRDIPTIRVYEDLISVKQPVFWPSDTHWNARGLKIVLEKTLETYAEYTQ